MRLVCPNCSAQYEIDGSMIPDGGRDVQCSNCGHTWFELPPPKVDFDELGPDDFSDPAGEAPVEEDAETEETVEAAEDTGDTAEAEPEEAESEAEDTPAPVEETPDIYDDSDPDDFEEDLSPSSAVAAAAAAAVSQQDVVTAPAPRRPGDTEALNILREEAERELSQRRAPPSESIETQTDLGLEEIRNRQTPSRALRARMAHLGEETTEETEAETLEADKPAVTPARPVSEPRPQQPPQEEETYEAPRRDLLPDIDEINSTLKPARRAAADQQSRGGFLTGFLLMIVLAAALILAYAQAPAIAQAFPGAENALIGYVDRANALRDWLGALF